MYGWIHACLEKMILALHGEEIWAKIKNTAGCEVKTGDWIRYDNYSDDETFALVEASCKVLNTDSDTILELFGKYFMEYVREEGYANMLTVLGSDLREWLTNVNDLHSHLRSSLPNAMFPEFLCVNDDEAVLGVESMILHYYSKVCF
jgi:guanylate cyclase soluble subunit beta